MDYTVSLSVVMQLRLRALTDQGTNQGRREAVIEAARLIEAGLRTQPHSTGEKLYHLPTGIPVRHVVSYPLSAHAAVYTPERFVAVFRIDLMAASGE